MQIELPSIGLDEYLIRETRRCVRAPVSRFRHPWIAPMAPPAGEQNEERFRLGDYSGGLFHHDVSESAIELCRDAELARVCFGSLLCFLDTADETGRVHRIELPTRTRDAEPAKPVMAQLALRAIDGMHDGLERADEHAVLARLVAFVDYLERETTGANGLLLTPSSRASGFDSDVHTAGFAEFSIEGPDTSTFFVLELEALALLAARLGDAGKARELGERAALWREAVDRVLWDDATESYVARRGSATHGAGAGTSWITLLPLYAGIPSAERAGPLLDRLCDAAKYWGPRGVRTVAADDVYFNQAARVMVYDPRKGEPGPVSNWSGPVWVLSSYYMFRALERYGRTAEADELALRTGRLLSEDLATTGALHECYDDAGRGLWPRCGTFVSWNVLAVTMLRAAAERARGGAFSCALSPPRASSDADRTSAGRQSA